MYYPYLRGRQYELIAIREMNKQNLLGSRIIPVVEPVKASSTLLSVLKDFSNKDNRIALVKNPQVGSFLAESAKNKKFYSIYEQYCAEEFCINAYILNSDIIHGSQLSDVPNESIFICMDKDTIQYATSLQDNGNIFIPDETIFRRSITTNRVIIADRFNKKEKNADYINSDDEFFSDDHTHFISEGYKGFSDYSIVGDEYNESGFAPYAVAIHMVYFDKDKILRVHHFVSKTNDDNKDTAGKFAEAVEKLVSFPLLQNTQNQTYAYDIYKILQKRGEYPGLGTIKKLSLMHHFELISRYFSNQV
jgi:hypothetical protein